MRRDEPLPLRVSFSRPVWWALALFGFLMLGSLVLQLRLIHQQRDLARNQKALAVATLRAVGPPSRRALPLTEQALRALPRVRAVAGRVDRLSRSAGPLAEELRAAGLPRAAHALGVLALELEQADLTGTVRGVGEVTATLGEHTRLERLLRSTITVLGTVRSTALVQRLARTVPRLDRTQSQALSILRRSLRVQQQTLTLNRRNLATAQATLAVARQTLSHAASLDDKLAGPLLGTGR